MVGPPLIFFMVDLLLALMLHFGLKNEVRVNKMCMGKVKRVVMRERNLCQILKFKCFLPLEIVVVT